MSQPKIILKPPQGRILSFSKVPEPYGVSYLEDKLADLMPGFYREGLNIESITLTAENWEAFGIDNYYESEFTIEAALGPVTFRKGAR